MTGYTKGHAEIKEIAETLYKNKPDWTTFYLEILGLQGIVRRSHQTLESLSEFEQSEVYMEIQCMLTELRRASRNPADSKKQQAEKQLLDPEDSDSTEFREPELVSDRKPPTAEPTKVITVRIPKSLHDALRIEAFEHRTSMNKLCISKLVQIINAKMVPTDSLMDSWGEVAAERLSLDIDQAEDEA